MASMDFLWLGWMNQPSNGLARKGKIQSNNLTLFLTVKLLVLQIKIFHEIHCFSIQYMRAESFAKKVLIKMCISSSEFMGKDHATKK